MGNSSNKFKKALQEGNEVVACQLYLQNPDIRERLDLNSPNKDTIHHNTPLHYAAKYGMKSLLKDFLLRGGNPNKQNSLDQTALHMLMMAPSGTMKSVDQRRLDCLHMLLKWNGKAANDRVKEKLKLDATDNERKTALHMAALSGLSLCVQSLVANGTSLFIEDNQGLTACEVAEKEQHHAVAAFLEAKMVFNLQEDVILDPEDGTLDTLQDEEYFGLCAQDLQEIKDQLIVETSDMLQIPLFTAEGLLRNHEWSREQLLEAWMEDPLAACEKAGVKLSQDHIALDAMKNRLNGVKKRPEVSVSDSNTIKHKCDICDEIISSDENTIDVPCGHMFCKDCWERYLSTKIVDGDTLNILCPGHECNKLVPVEITERLVSRDMAKRYLHFDIKAFVDTNPNLRWCPHPGCGRAVKLPYLPSTSRGIDFSTSNKAKSVDCGQGHYFCWTCLDEAHEPCKCEVWQQWKKVVEEINPTKANEQSEERETVANAYWLISNSKKCPNCRSHIQKHEGCNHMTCAKCKHGFCWVCLEPWKIHSAETGGYFRCNRYEVVNAVEDNYEKEQRQIEKEHDEVERINRFMHYYARCKNHENSFQLESKLLNAAQEKATGLQKTAAELDEGCVVDVNFIEESIKELLKARQILKGSYPYGYFLEDVRGERAVFESLQDEVEQATEMLSGMVARQFLKTPKNKIITAARKLRRRKREFLSAVERGLIPDDDDYDFSGSKSFQQSTRPRAIHRRESGDEDSSLLWNEFQRRRQRSRHRKTSDTLNSDSDQGSLPLDNEIFHWLEMIRLELREANSSDGDRGRQGAMFKLRRRVEEAYRKRKMNSKKKKSKHGGSDAYPDITTPEAGAEAGTSKNRTDRPRVRKVVLFTDESSSSEEEHGYAKKASRADAPVIVTDESDSDTSDFGVTGLQAAAASIVALTKTYVAQFDYNCESASEISLEAGDVVEVLDQRKSGWWLGRCRGKEGLFPASFVVEIDAEQSNEAAPPAANVPAEQTNTEEHDHLLQQALELSLAEK